MDRTYQWDSRRPGAYPGSPRATLLAGGSSAAAASAAAANADDDGPPMGAPHFDSPSMFVAFSPTTSEEEREMEMAPAPRRPRASRASRASRAPQDSQATEASQATHASQAAQASQASQAIQASQAAQASQAPQDPQVPQAPQVGSQPQMQAVLPGPADVPLPMTAPNLSMPFAAPNIPMPIASASLPMPLPATSSNAPNVVVLNDMPWGSDAADKAQASITSDHWISSADGRYSSPQVLIRVGPIGNMQPFYVHKDILTKAKWFRKALCGKFKEAEQQSIDLPEEDPDIFHFLVAYLYDARYTPIRLASAALDRSETKDKGKGKAKARARDREPEIVNPHEAAEQDLQATLAAWNLRHNHRPAQAFLASRPGNISTAPAVPRPKTPTTHRLGCLCPTCTRHPSSATCWNCGTRVSLDRPLGMHRQMVRNPLDDMDPPLNAIEIQVQPLPHGPGGGANGPHLREQLDANRRNTQQGMTKEDLRSWLMAFELDLDVYICAERYLMDGFRKLVSRHAVDLLESAGVEAADPKMLHLCKKLFSNVPADDSLLKMLLARVGFLQSRLWKQAPEETQEFLVNNPEVATAILKETVLRHDLAPDHTDLPSMEVPRGLRRANT